MSDDGVPTVRHPRANNPAKVVANAIFDTAMDDAGVWFGGLANSRTAEEYADVILECLAIAGWQLVRVDAR